MLSSSDLRDNPITTIRGVDFPTTLHTLYLPDNISFLELKESNVEVFQHLAHFSGSAKTTRCSGGALRTVHNFALCVITDAKFEELYGDYKSGSDITRWLVPIMVGGPFVLALCWEMVKRSRSNKRQKELAARLLAENSTNASGGTGFSTLASLFTDTVDHDRASLWGPPIERLLLKRRIASQDLVLDADQPIASGGFGVVYVATFQRCTTVVVKKIAPNRAKDDQALRDFLAEIKLCAELDHPKIVRFLGVSWRTLADMAVVLEYMPRGDLAQLLQRQQPRQRHHSREFGWFDSGSSGLPTKAALALDVLEAVVYLHSFPCPIIHRDLKSKNVLLGADYEAKLGDFGVSRAWREDATLTAGVGTMAWIAPEVLRGERYTEQADMYSFGVLLTELSTCAKPFDGVSSALVLLQVTTGDARPTMSDGCPQAIRDLADRCLSVVAHDRPSAMAVHYQLRTLCQQAQQQQQQEDSDADDTYAF